jgi:hypothetical protein
MTAHKITFLGGVDSDPIQPHGDIVPSEKTRPKSKLKSKLTASN